MWNTRELKKAARGQMKRNYWRMVMCCLLVAVFAGGTSGLALASDGIEALGGLNFRTASNTEIVNDFLEEYATRNHMLWGAAQQMPRATKGILAGVFNNATRSGSLLFGVLNAVNQFVFQDRIMAGVIILVGAVLIFLYWLFLGNTLRVGECRFFLENAAYPKTSPARLLFLFKLKKKRNTIKIMFLRYLFTGLWMLTLVGGVVKFYQYRMIPYLLAENPDITRREAFELSARMMRGEKWRCFLMDASFAGWFLLASLTGVGGILLLYPYRNATEAGLYLHLRERALAHQPGAVALLTDQWLGGPLDGTPREEYPVEHFPIPEHPSFFWITVDAQRHYNLRSLVLMFFAFCVGGYLWEVFVDLANTGTLVNRGTLFGPWLPIYGTGGLLIILLLRRFSARPVFTFLLTVGLAGVLEYATSWALEALFGAKWWDYSGYFLNINGRVCAEGLLVFGIGGCLAIYLLAPSLDNLFAKIPKKTSTVLCMVLVVLFVCDVAYSARHPNLEASTANPHSSTAMDAGTGQAAFPRSPGWVIL